MADDKQELPNIMVLGFFSTFEKLPLRDEFGEYIMIEKPGGKTERKMAVQQVDWVTYSPTSSALTMRNTERVKQLDPEELAKRNDASGRMDETGQRAAFFNARWSQIKPAYEAWKRGEELAVDGTPLQSWPALRPEHIAAFTPYGVRTVEQVANMQSAIRERIKLPNVDSYIKMAREFIANLDRAASAERAADQQAQIDDLQDKLDRAMALLEKMSGEDASAQPADEDAPKSASASASSRKRSKSLAAASQAEA